MADWDEHAASWDSSAAVRAYADAAFASLTSLADTIGFELVGSTACDFGCGTGLLTERLADRCARIDAVDTSSAMRAELEAKIAQRRWSHVRALDQLPSEPRRYDLIVCSSVLAFVDDHPATVDTLATLLAPGGLFVQWDWELDPDADEPFGLTTAGVRQALESAGLESVTVGTGFDVPVEGEHLRPLMGSGRKGR